METYIIPIGENKNIVFVPQNINYFIANDLTAHLVKRLNEPYENIEGSFPGLTREMYNELVKKISEENTKRVISIPEAQLERLIINISNDCNLRCKYCYANQGTYGEAANIISIQCLKKVLDTFFEIFDTIGVIQLFGGEPTLNMKAIEFTGEYLKKEGHSTQLGLVTNATIVNSCLIDMINKYDIKVTVSVDIEKTHDDLRPFPKDMPSWKWIKENIHKLQDNTGQPSQIEFTFTKVHETRDLSICNILEELKQEYGNIPVHMVPVCSNDVTYHLSDRDAFINSVADIYSLKEHGIELTYSTLKSLELSLKHKIPFDFFCGAGISTLAVSTHGNIYPCFYFIDNSKFKIAGVNDAVADIKKSILEIRTEFYSKSKCKIKKCSDCFAKAVCTGCLGANYTENGDLFKPVAEHCNMTKGMIRKILENAAKS